MKAILCLLALIPTIVCPHAIAQDLALSKIIRPQGSGFGAGDFEVFVCEKEKNCVVKVNVATDPFNAANDCLVRTPAVVVAGKKTTTITWEIKTVSGGPYRFNENPGQAIQIDKNYDRKGQEAFIKHTNESSQKHRKEVNTAEANAFTYTVRVDTQASGGYQPCTAHDPVVVSRD